MPDRRDKEVLMLGYIVLNIERRIDDLSKRNEMYSVWEKVLYYVC